MNDLITNQGNGDSEIPRAEHRSIRERWVIEGQLILEAPAHFGSGEVSDFTDMPVLLDETDGAPLLPGTSIAGALRNYLRVFESGDGVPLPVLPRNNSLEEENRYKAELKKEREFAATLLFGGFRGDDDSEQSPLVVNDAPGKATGYELRDGVAIDSRWRTAALDENERGKKFDIQLLSAGSTFNLRFELAVGAPRDLLDNQYQTHRQQLLDALAITLDGLSRGHIGLGMRKRRGYGQCSVKEWEVRHYDLTQINGLLAWLVSERGAEKDSWYAPVPTIRDTDIAKALNASIEAIPDKRNRVTLSATFTLDGSLLIRSGFGEADSGPDMVHLHSPRVSKDKPVPIIPGTSWAGVLRHRASRIARTISGKDPKGVQTFIDGIFGPSEIEKGDSHTWASRLSVAESAIDGGHSLVQTRVKIDRFTGGAFETALFSEQPLYGDRSTRLTLDLVLRSQATDSTVTGPKPVDPAEVGLLLLLLKDLWTGDLPIGGESSVGRGRLQGIEATLNVEGKTWKFTRAEDGGLVVDDRDILQKYVDAFNQRMVQDG